MEFEHFKDCTLEELVADQQFKTWVFEPTAESDHYWKTFVKVYPKKETAIKEARAILLGMKVFFEEEDASPGEIENSLQAVLTQSANLTTAGKKNKVRTLNLRIRLSIAAVLLAAIGLLAWFWLNNQPTFRTYATGFAEWQTIVLPDSSIVKLNANSELKITGNWAEGATRQVWLEGEAFFKVKKKPATQAKFKVLTKDLTVEVLGTSFNVHRRGTETKVFLEEGKVKLGLEEQKKQEVILSPGEMVTYSQTAKEIIEHKPVVAVYQTSWKEGNLLFHNDTPLSTVLQEIEAIYGIQFKVDNPATYNRKAHVGLPMKTLNIVLNKLGLAMGLNITKEEGIYLIKEK